MRFVQETADAVEFTNRFLLASANPAPQSCDHVEVWSCLLSNQTGCFIKNCKDFAGSDSVGRGNVLLSSRPDNDFSGTCKLTHFLISDGDQQPAALKFGTSFRFAGSASGQKPATIRMTVAVPANKLSCFSMDGRQMCLVLGGQDFHSPVAGPSVGSFADQTLVSDVSFQKAGDGTEWRTVGIEFPATGFGASCE